ncbi:ATP-binding protein [Streptosporangium sp. NPDC051023]|uniref:sensor histidine kinase n=1 Tax=Streptosporangium sp. NPDC051023 TaxID=3155410 RepID=UPI00344F53FB
MSLRSRLVTLFTLGVAAVIAIAGAVFLNQLRSSLDSALDETLNARADAVAARLALTRPVSPPEHEGDQRDDHQGEFSESDEVTQILTPEGGVLEATGAPRGKALLTADELRRASEDPLSFTTTVAGERVRLLATPARGAGRTVVVVGTSTEVVDAAQRRARTAIWVASVPAAVVAGFGAWLLAGAALRPVNRMRRRLTEITEHDLGARLRVPRTRDEIAALARAMNALLDRLQRAMARQRGFVADAGHELRTPLTALKAELELAARPGRSRQMLDDAIAAAATDTERLIRLAEDLLLLARSDEGPDFLRPEPIVLSEVVAASIRSVEAVATSRSIEIVLRAEAEFRVVADPDRLRQAVENLLGNALRHAPEGSVIDVDVRRGTGEGGRRTVVIEVRDHGPGFPPDFLPYAFERFRRADPGRARERGGAGLGLALVASIARAHGGDAKAANHPDGGARVSMFIRDA